MCDIFCSFSLKFVIVVIRHLEAAQLVCGSQFQACCLSFFSSSLRSLFDMMLHHMLWRLTHLDFLASVWTFVLWASLLPNVKLWSDGPDSKCNVFVILSASLLSIRSLWLWDDELILVRPWITWITWMRSNRLLKLFPIWLLSPIHI